jgi:hypothetical protein
VVLSTSKRVDFHRILTRCLGSNGSRLSGSVIHARFPGAEVLPLRTLSCRRKRERSDMDTRTVCRRIQLSLKVAGQAVPANADP